MSLLQAIGYFWEMLDLGRCVRLVIGGEYTSVCVRKLADEE